MFCGCKGTHFFYYLSYLNRGSYNQFLGFLHRKVLKMMYGSFLGTTNPLTIGISAENQWVFVFSCQS